MSSLIGNNAVALQRRIVGLPQQHWEPAVAHKPRLHVPGGLYHVMLRGNDGQDIFIDDSDRLRLEALVADGIERYGHRIHAYCWMGNHIHLALQVGTIPLSKIMHNISFRYTRYFNWRHQRIGHLFQGRYQAILVDADAYLLHLVRYIHLNPVRAHLVVEADSCVWSGHRVYLGLAVQPWLSVEWVLSYFSEELEQARLRYRRFVAMPKFLQIVPDFKRGTSAGRLIGNDQFARRMLNAAVTPGAAALPDLRTVCHAVCVAAGISEHAFRCRSRRRSLVQARSVAAYLVAERKAGSLADLARHLERDPANLSRSAEAVRRAADGHALKVLAQCAERILDSTIPQA